MSEKILWHTLTRAKTLNQLKSSDQGLTSAEAGKRLKKFGPNRLPQEKKIPALMVLVSQFKSPLVYVLIGAGVITFLLQDYIDMAIILAAVFVNTSLGFIQENKANKSIHFLHQLIDQKARVLRDGNEALISAAALVPGDIMILSAGDKISADGRILNVDNFTVTEASLTGESVPSTKTNVVLDKGTGLADRENLVFSGTVVATGRAGAIVCETGLNSEIGQITQLVKETKEEKTPLQIQLAKFSRLLTYVVLGITFLIIVLGKIQGRPIFGFGQTAREGMLNIGAAIAVAAIPEGLLVSVTAILAIGMQAILKKKALVRKLIAAETLGGISIICTDKTGTLTEGKMHVSRIATLSQEVKIDPQHRFDGNGSIKDHDLILKISLLCNDAAIENPADELKQWRFIGSPTETALLFAAIQAGIPYQKIKKEQTRLAEIPFDSEWKYLATLNRLDQDRNVIYVKGAPEKIIEMSSLVRIDGKKEKLTPARIKLIKSKAEELTKQGLRLLAFGYRQTPAKNPGLKKEDLTDLIFIGFIALHDPLRPETKETFKIARQAGIRPIIVTGDHRLTAQAIVKELGLEITKENILDGQELDNLSDDELEKKVAAIDVYARVEPRHKLRIISAWQKKGEVVAMTGDGVNDAPAIKAADIGIALGSGTDVAKETADLILLDNNFATIITAVERGRIIFENIKKVILYLLSDSFSEMVLITASLILNLPLAILPAQIIWINLIDDGLPNLALTFEPGEPEVMKAKPRKKNEKILNSEMKTLIFIIGISINVLILSVFYLLFKFSDYSISHIRTIIFATLGIDSLLYVFACRSLRHSLFTKNPLTNKFLLISVLVGLVLQLLAIYEPHLQLIFDTVNLNALDLLLVFSLAIISLLGIEITKHFFIIKQQKNDAYGQSS